MQILHALIGTKRVRDIHRLRPLVRRINELESQYQALSEAELRRKTDEFRNRYADGESLDDLLGEAYAVVKNACRRLVGHKFEVCGHETTWDMVPFDVQLMGAIVLHQGKIAEMATGEGKTLVATMPLYLNALSSRNVHLVTVNDYLARRDAQWMGVIYEYLGVTVGCIQNDMGYQERRAQYAKDITYGTNSEFGFDYLRDNGLAYSREELVQRGHFYAIVDEVDSILIDEARTPLIISGPAPAVSQQYFELKPKVEALVAKQRAMCNRLMQEAKELLEKGDTEPAQRMLYQVHQGMPKHKQLMHMLEDPAARKLLEQVEAAMLTDMRKDEARALREELYFVIDERGRDVTLTEKGCEALDPSAPDSYVLPDLVTELAELDGDSSLSEKERRLRRQRIQRVFAEKSERIHTVDQLIRAYCLYERDVDYVVQGEQVLIVDEFTGRILPGRRWSDGLHQAVEAKEGARIERETQTLATITIQNYFRLYEKLAGMTGTAETEAAEFRDIYKLDVVVIPTNRPVRRLDYNDAIYKTQREKYKAIIAQVEECYKRGQPVLLGTISVETSEVLSRMLKRANIPHNVLNAKNHEREAEIVVRAGQYGAVTIATNMAGRGTDIKLGKEVVHLDRSVVESSLTLDDSLNGRTLRELLLEKPCGLFVIGSERHEARRIDRQLRGRCARQGDPGASRFYISLEDDLMRLFGSDRIARIMSRFNWEEGQPLEHRWLNRSIETAQRRVEQHNYAIRRRTLQYDDVMNMQRATIYQLRNEILTGQNVRDRIHEIFREVIETQVELAFSSGDPHAVRLFADWVQTTFPIPARASDIEAKRDNPEAVVDDLYEKVRHAYELKVASEAPEKIEALERHVILNCIDSRWQDYLRAMDALREGVGLRAYGQQDPLIEYKREAFGMFNELMAAIKNDISAGVFRSSTSEESFKSFLESLVLVHNQVSVLGAGSATAGSAPTGPLAPADAGQPAPRAPATYRREGPKVGRNAPCPCGSGKKYKKCCGK